MRDLEGRSIDGRYLLRKRIGEGGFGAVFLSEQRFLGHPVRSVAVKLSRRTGMSVATAREVFADALLLAEVMDKVTDGDIRRHLVHVYDAGLTDDGRGYLAMEYIEGTTLATQFASYGRVPSEQMFRWARQICAALQGLHSLDTPLIHRDLKPDNVLLGKDLTIRLVDFGLAAHMLRLGYAPGVAGTITYMAPETSQGKSRPSSDLYSLGLLIYEGLTGTHPFADLIPPADLPPELHGDWLHERKERYRPDPPSTLNGTVPAHLDEVVMRCLEFEPGRRYQSAADLLAAMEARSWTRPRETSIEVARRLRAEGDLRRTRRVLEEALAATPPPGERLSLLGELGEVLTQDGEHRAAAAAFAEQWKLVESHPTVVRTRRDRAAIACRAAAAFEAADNRFQTERFRRICDAERGRR